LLDSVGMNTIWPSVLYKLMKAGVKYWLILHYQTLVQNSNLSFRHKHTGVIHSELVVSDIAY